MSNVSATLGGADGAPEPSCKCGAGPSADRRDRCTRGHVLKGNTAAVLVGAESAAFWREEQAARDEITHELLTDRGTTIAEAPRAVVLTADSAAQAAILRDAAYRRIVETGGPLASDGRARRAFEVWCAAADRLEKHLRLLGLERKAKAPQSVADFIEARAKQAEAVEREEPEQ